jgi:hypothetical protein
VALAVAKVDQVPVEAAEALVVTKLLQVFLFL